MAKENGVFDIPDQSIVVKGVEEGSAAWMKKVTKEHGDTAPQKLERRRERLSAFSILMDQALKKLQMGKKVYISRNEKLQEETKKKLAATDPTSVDFAKISEYMGHLQLERMSQEQQYDILINQSITNQAIVEGQCLIVDCLTLREPVRSKGGKIGQLRFSVGLYACDAAFYAGKAYRRTKKMFELMAARDPLLAGSVSAEDDDEESDDAEYDDDDVVNEDDRKAIKDEIGGADFEE